MRLYAADRAGILAALSAVAVQRIRRMAAAAFADAFAARKNRDDND
jgi:hypothetical protein